MQSHDALQSFFGLIASTVERSQLENQIQFQENPCGDQSSSDEDQAPGSFTGTVTRAIRRRPAPRGASVQVAAPDTPTVGRGLANSLGSTARPWGH